MQPHVRTVSTDGTIASTSSGGDESGSTTLEEAIGRGVPVVLTSRCHAGTTAGRYGGPGSGQTLLEAGAISGGDLPAWKARLRTALVLSMLEGGEEQTAIDRVAASFDGVDSVA